MKRLLTIFLFVSAATFSYGQTVADPEFKFHEAANLYINKDYDKALASVKEGLKMAPNSQRLEELRKLLEQEKKDQQKKDQEKKQQDEKQKKDQQKQEQEKKDQEQKEEDEKNKDKQKKEDEQKKEEQEKKDQQKDKEQQEKEDETKKEEEEKRPPAFDQQKIPKISEEKAKMILEAMRNQEKQYLQQLKRKQKQPKDRGKPDW